MVSPVIEQLSFRIDFLALSRHKPQRYPHLLQSVAHTTRQTHYDILFAFPQATLELSTDFKLGVKGDDKRLEQYRQVLTGESGDFLDTLDSLWKQEAGDVSSSPMPFCGGWFVYLSYELAQQIEPGLKLPAPSQQDLPVAFATRIPVALIENRKSGEQFIVAEHGYKQYISKVMNDIESLSFTENSSSVSNNLPEIVADSIEEENAQRYLDSVLAIKRYIREGDVFQVNLSRQWLGKLKGHEQPGFEIYQRLCLTNPAPFSCLVNYGDHVIISSSPERLVRITDNQIETRPIAGTRPRGINVEEDDGYLRELIGHPKERAEHIMLIDLERNDLGRVCVPGTVKVNELMVLETYAHVHHIVSNITGQLRQDVTPGNVIAAVFPGGTITGCPKVRCMEIIAELEKLPRGAYTGSIGYINHNGDMDFNILIRTMVMSNNTISLRAGAGIVTDSDPQHELQETRAKAKGMLLALQ